MLEIIMKSQEAGGKVIRQWRLADNDKIVKAVMGAIKRHNVTGDADLSDALRAPAPLIEGEPSPAGEEEAQSPAGEEGEPRPTGKGYKEYKGFVMVKCERCGKVTATNLRKPAHSLLCEGCGEEMELTALVVAKFKCPCCEKEWSYRTNAEASPLIASCLNCGGEMVSWWNQRKNRFQPAD